MRKTNDPLFKGLGQPRQSATMRLFVWFLRLLGLLIILLLGPLTAFLFADLDLDTHWSDASLDSTGQAPDPVTTPEAIVQVYAARAYNWRGAFGTHSWVSVKPADADHYTVYQLIGWRLRSAGTAVSIREGGPPDFLWFNAEPERLVEHRGDAAEALIPRIEKAVESYPCGGEYSVWPGPNSNTFIAWIAREVPDLRLDLPPTAIGKDYLPNGDLIASTPSGTGKQLSLGGLLGASIATEEGLELNLLGLSFGIDFNDLALRIPGWGRVSLIP